MNFLPLSWRSGAAPDSGALAALTEKANAAAARVDQLTTALSEAQSSIAALTTERDGTAASLAEALAKVTTAETALSERNAAFEALEKEVPEKVKAAAIALVAGQGIPAGQTPAANANGASLAADLATSASPREASAARLAAFTRPIA